MKDPDGYQETDTSEDVTLFSTKKTVKAIESPVKNQIIQLLKGRDLSFEEIVHYTGKAKSTISVHIRDLEENGIVRSLPDPEDRRKRIISLFASPIGSLTQRDRFVEERIISENIIEKNLSEGDIALFFKYLFRMFRTEAMHQGINIDPVLEKAGYRVGKMLIPLVDNPDIVVLVNGMDQFWRKYGLGIISLLQTEPLILQVEGCFECEDLPLTGHGACAFDIGLLTAIFTHYFKDKVKVTEEECYSSGFSHCTFHIQQIKDHPN